METSGFTEEQLSVREAVQKICSNFSDVMPRAISDYPPEEHRLMLVSRTIGSNTTRLRHIHMSCTLPWLKTVGLALRCRGNSVVPGWA